MTLISFYSSFLVLQVRCSLVLYFYSSLSVLIIFSNFLCKLQLWLMVNDWMDDLGLRGQFGGLLDFNCSQRWLTRAENCICPLGCSNDWTSTSPTISFSIILFYSLHEQCNSATWILFIYWTTQNLCDILNILLNTHAISYIISQVHLSILHCRCI